MTEDNHDESIRDVVAEWVEKRERTLRSLLAQRQSLDDEIARVRRSLEDVRPFAQTLGIETHELQPTILTTGMRRRASRGVPRRPEFAAFSLPDAVERILRENPNKEIHADEFVSLIYDAATPAEQRSAKSSVVPPLSAGVKDGKWRRVRPNTFKLDAPEGEQAVVSDRAPPLM
jgi:hypothetical protein